MSYPQIGIKLSCGYTIDANYRNRYVLAYSATAAQPYAVWDVSDSGDTINGRYFSSNIAAQKCFADLCFDWMQENETEKAPEVEAQELGDNLKSKTNIELFFSNPKNFLVNEAFEILLQTKSQSLKLRVLELLNKI
ncbi:MAG: hypothetical protein RRY14_07735 [Hydrogenoanaerobacterium sp.]